MTNIRNVSGSVTPAQQNWADGWSDWIQSEDWMRFCTFTTRYELTLPSARRLMERFFDRTSDRVFPDEELRLFWVAEKFECKHGYHTHGLLWHEDRERPWNVMQVLTEAYQVASAARKQGDRFRVSFNRYDKRKLGGRYCAKYLLKRYADFDLLT